MSWPSRSEILVRKKKNIFSDHYPEIIKKRRVRADKKWADRREVIFFSQVNVHTYPKSGCDTLFFWWIRVVIWWKTFIFSNVNFTSRRSAHFLPHVTNIFGGVFGLVRASAFLFFNMFSLTLGSGGRLKIMLQAVFRQSWVRIRVCNFEKSRFWIVACCEQQQQQTDRKMRFWLTRI